MKFKWDKKYLHWGVTAFCVIAASILFYRITGRWGVFSTGLGFVLRVFTPFVYGFAIAYLLNNVMRVFELHVFKKTGRALYPQSERKAARATRTISMICTYVLFLGIMAGLLVLILPQLYYSIAALVDKSSEYVAVAMKWLEERDFSNTAFEDTAIRWINTGVDYVTSWLSTNLLPRMSTLLTSITGGVISVIKTIVNVFIGVIVSVYILFRKETFKAQGKKLLYSIFKIKTANRIMEEGEFINEAFGKYITGALIDSLIVGVVNYLFMLIVGMPYAALVSILVAVTNLIPIFGPFIGAIPSALLILLENPAQCLIFIIFTLILQQIDGNILKPQIHGSASGLSGFWVMFAIIVFGGLFGIIGMVLGVPVFAVIYQALHALIANLLYKKDLPETTEEYLKIDRLDSETGKPLYKK